ncbi:nucleolar protein 8 [Balamuthia mandrillaris]
MELRRGAPNLTQKRRSGGGFPPHPSSERRGTETKGEAPTEAAKQRGKQQDAAAALPSKPQPPPPTSTALASATTKGTAASLGPDPEGYYRLFVGSLPKEITEEFLAKLFSSFGEVRNFGINRKNEAIGQVFAHVDLKPKAKIETCLSTLNKTKWKGKVLRIERAKENYTIRLQKEKEQQGNKDQTKGEEKAEGVNPDGTAIKRVAGQWKRGKAGRFLPVLRLPTKNNKGVFVHDPTNYKDNITILAFRNDISRPLHQLAYTWDPSSASSKRTTATPKQTKVTKEQSSSEEEEEEESSSSKDEQEEKEESEEDEEEEVEVDEAPADKIYEALLTEKKTSLSVLESLFPGGEDEEKRELAVEDMMDVVEEVRQLQHVDEDEDEERETEHEEESKEDSEDEVSKAEEEEESEEESEGEETSKTKQEEKTEQTNDTPNDSTTSPPQTITKEEQQGYLSRLETPTGEFTLKFKHWSRLAAEKEASFALFGSSSTSSSSQNSNSFSFGFSAAGSPQPESTPAPSTAFETQNDEEEERPQQNDNTVSSLLATTTDEVPVFLFGGRRPEECAFMRNTNLEQVQQEWANKRQMLTRDYKKKMKSAQKKRRKLSSS